MLVVDGCLLVLVAAAAIIDLSRGKVPNWLTYPAVLVGLAVAGLLEAWPRLAQVVAFKGWPDLGSSGLGLAVGFLPLFVFYRMGAGLGGGDVKLMGAVGAVRGWPFIIVSLFYSFIVAAALGVAMMVWRRQTLATLRRIGRTLKSVVVPGMPLVSPTSPESIQVPFAVCVCLGTAWGLSEAALGRSLWEAVRQWL